MLEEKWLPIPGYEGIYEVSTFGRVRSLDRITKSSNGVIRQFRGQIRKPVLRQGRQHLILYKPGMKDRLWLVHILVLTAFSGLRPEGMVGRHLNGNPIDNRVENLAWGTWSDNNYDQVRHGTHYEARRTHCDNGHPFSGDNVRISRNARVCRACARDSTRRYLARRAAKEVS